jgi:hypothetical protein
MRAITQRIVHLQTEEFHGSISGEMEVVQEIISLASAVILIACS